MSTASERRQKEYIESTNLNVEVNGNEILISKGDQSIAMEVREISRRILEDEELDRAAPGTESIGLYHPEDSIEGRQGQIEINNRNWTKKARKGNDLDEYNWKVRTSFVDVGEESQMEENITIHLTLGEYEELVETVIGELAENENINYKEKEAKDV